MTQTADSTSGLARPRAWALGPGWGLRYATHLVCVVTVIGENMLGMELENACCQRSCVTAVTAAQRMHALSLSVSLPLSLSLQPMYAAHDTPSRTTAHSEQVSLSHATTQSAATLPTYTQT